MKIRQSAILSIKFLLKEFKISVPENLVEQVFDVSSSGSVLDCFIATCYNVGLDVTQLSIKDMKGQTKVNFPKVVFNLEKFYVVTGEKNDLEFLIHDPFFLENSIQKEKLFLEEENHLSIMTFKESGNRVQSLNMKYEVKLGRNSEPICDICNRFITEYYPNCYGSCLTGSYADNKNSINSDVDIIVISEFHRNVVKETIKYSELTFDVYIYPKLSFSRFILQDVKLLSSYLIDRVRKAIILNDTNDYLQGMIIRCNVLFRQGPQKVENSKLLYARHFLIGNLEKLKRDPPREKSIVHVNRILDSLLTMNAYVNKIWVDKSVELMDPEFMRELFDSVDMFYKDNSSREIIEITESMLLDTGSVNTGYNTSFSLPDYSSTRVVIGIGNCREWNDVITQIFLPLKDSTVHEFIYFYRNTNPDYPGIHYFVVLFNFEQERKNSIMSKLQFFCNELELRIPQIRVIYPYNLAKSVYFIDPPLETDLYFQRVFLHRIDHLGKLEIRSLIYYIGTALAIKNEISPSQLKCYYQLLLKTWLVERFDEKLNNTFQLMEKMENGLAEIKQKYETRDALLENVENDVKSFIKTKTYPIEFDAWVSDLEKAIPTMRIYNNYYFRVHNYIHDFKEVGIKDSIEFYKFQMVIDYFIDILNISNEAKCYYAYGMLRAI